MTIKLTRSKYGIFWIFSSSFIAGILAIIFAVHGFAILTFFTGTNNLKPTLTELVQTRRGVVSFIDYSRQIIFIEYQKPEEFTATSKEAIFFNASTSVETEAIVADDNGVIYSVKTSIPSSISNIKIGEHIETHSWIKNDIYEAFSILHGDMLFYTINYKKL